MRNACPKSLKGTEPHCAIVWDVLFRAGCEERGERAMPEELRGQLVRHHPGLVLQKEALAGELPVGLFASFVFATPLFSL